MTEVKPRRTRAVFYKQIKDTLKNKGTLIQFVMFPLLAFVFTEAIAKNQSDLPDHYFVIMFATMYAGFVPMVTMTSIISEEKEMHTLKVLIMANVRPNQYLCGVGSYVLLMCFLGSCVFGAIGGYSGLDFLRFLAVMLCGVMASILLGAAVGLLTKNQMSATAVILPIGMIAGFLPMIATFNQKFAAVTRILYTQQVNDMINEKVSANLTPERFLIIAANMILFLGVFMCAYKRGNLSD